MTTTIETLPGSEPLTCEAGGWIACRVPQPDIEADALDLLSRSAAPRPGNLRFALNGRQVYLVGELRDADGLLTVSDAHELLFGNAAEAVVEVAQIDVACVLGETEAEWSQPDESADCWQAMAQGPRGHRCELTATLVPGGVEVSGRLADWETDLADTARAAIANFLATVQGRIRFARFAAQDREASAVSFASQARLDIELPDSVAAVMTACRLVWREVRALADDTVARAYLEATE